ncbi:MAG: hypothetical protein AAF399_05425 [Bacteroidota bacterium]
MPKEIMRIVCSLLFSLLIAWGGMLSAQTLPYPEYVVAHLDKDFYVAGEDVWYSIHFLNPQARRSNLVYVDVLGPDGKTVLSQMLRAEKGYAQGDIALPGNLKRGYYEFRVYTRWNLNFQDQEVYRRYLAVYEANENIEQLDSVTARSSPAWGKDFTISGSQASYSPREMVQLQLAPASPRDLQAQLSVSVLDEAYTGTANDSSWQPVMTRASARVVPPLAKNSQPVDPETDYSRTFIIKNPETGERITSNFVVCFVRQTGQRMLKVTSNGIVNLEFQDFYDSTEVQIFDTNPFKEVYTPEIGLVNRTIPVGSAQPMTDLPPLTPRVAAYLRAYQKRFQLMRMFGTTRLLRAARPVNQPLDKVPTTVYKTRDFIPQPSMYDFVKQVVNPVKIQQYGKGSDASYKLRLFVPHKANRASNKLVKKPPLMRVNEYFTYDVKNFVEMPWEDVTRVEVYNDAVELPGQFGPIGEFGVMAVYTKDPANTPAKIAQAPNNLMISGLYLPREFPLPNHSAEADEGSRLPDFRPMIYWNPHVLMDPMQSKTLDFPAPDKPGTYLVRIRGVWEDGSPIQSEYRIEVELKR